MSTSNKKFELKSALIAAIAASFLSACGGSGGGSSSNFTEQKEVTGRVVKGPVGDATIDVRTVNPFTGFVSDTVLATTTTSADGSFEFDFATVQGALMIETRGGSFIDESDQNTDGGEPRSIQLGPQDGFRVYRPSGVGNVAVTAITDAITARAFGIAMQNQISLDNAFETVRSLTSQALGFDPLTTPALNPLNPNTTDPDAIKYALMLGGLAVASHQIAIAAGLSQANGEVIQALVQDLLDGRLDGLSDGDPITLNGQNMPDIDLNGAINLFLNNNRPAYGDVATPSINEQVWSSEPSVSNTPPSIEVIPAATFVAEGGTLVLDSNVLTVSDAETATANLRFLVIQPPSFGILTDGTTTLQEGSLTSSTLRYQNQTFPGGAGDFISIAVVDADNGFAPVGFPIVVNGIPTAVNDSATTLEDTLVNIDVVVNDSDPENTTLNITNITNVSGGTPSVNGNRIDFLPALNFNGPAGFSYSATDGFHTVSANVAVAVTPVNDLPTISNIPNQTIAENTAATDIGFGVGDVETPPAALVVTASSGNPALVPNTNINVGPGTSASTRSLAITPAPNEFGEAQITVTVTDAGGLTANTSFTLTVNNIADPVMYVAPTAAGNNNCLSPSNACDSPALALATAAAASEVWMATGTYVVTAPLDMKDQVAIRGGYDAADYLATPSDDPRLTIVQANFAQNSQATLECGNGVSNQTKVEGLDIQGSATGTDTVAVRTSGSCNAVLTNNIMRGGAGSNQSIGLLVQGATGAVLVADGNFIDGGNSAAHPQGVALLTGGAIVKANQIFGGQASGATIEGLRIQSPTAEAAKVENNLISGGTSSSGFVTGILFEGSGHATVANNTIYGGGSDSTSSAIRFADATNGNGAPDLINNIFQADADQTGDSYCIRQEANAQTEPDQIHNNAFSDCIFYRTSGVEPGEFSNALGLEDYAANNQNTAINVRSVFEAKPAYVDELGADGNKAALFDNDWKLAPSTSCAVREGGIHNSNDPAVPVEDLDGVFRQTLFSGRCHYVEDFIGRAPPGVNAISLGAYEFELDVRYVSNVVGNDANDCATPATACASIERGIVATPPGGELRIEQNASTAYKLTGASSANGGSLFGQITKPMSIVGGYGTGFAGLPQCDKTTCDTSVEIDTPANRGGEYRNTVLHCDGTAGGLNQHNTLIAGLAIDAADTTGEAMLRDTRAIALTGGCNATVASNVISGGNGGSSTIPAEKRDSVGIYVDGISIPYIFKNFIDGGTGSNDRSLGIDLANAPTAAPQADIIIEENLITGSQPTNQALDSSAIQAGLESATSNRSLKILSNTIDGGTAQVVKAINFSGFGDLELGYNIIYGGVSLNVDGGNRATIATQLDVTGDVKVFNNFLHGGAGGTLFTQGLRVQGIDNANAGTLAIRNNTIFSGISPGTQRAVVFSLVQTGSGLNQLFVDNNIIFTPVSGGVDRRCIEEESTLVPNRVANNLFYNCDGKYIDNGVITDINAASNNASDNIAAGPGESLSGPAFVDEDGVDNLLESGDFDWRLTPQTPCEIADNALDGRFQTPAFGYADDIDHLLRDGGERPNGENPLLGWSMGAYEQDPPCGQAGG